MNIQVLSLHSIVVDDCVQADALETSLLESDEFPSDSSKDASTQSLASSTMCSALGLLGGPRVDARVDIDPRVLGCVLG